MLWTYFLVAVSRNSSYYTYISSTDYDKALGHFTPSMADNSYKNTLTVCLESSVR